MTDIAGKNPATRLLYHRCALLTLYLLWVNVANAANNTVEPNTFYAGQITTDNLSRIPAGGLDAIGGLDDWFVTDGTLCAIVSSKDHTTYLSLHGGVLVDLWHCDRANDQWSTAHQQYNLQKEEIPATHSITAGADEQSAWLETRAELAGVETVTRYAFNASPAGQLDIATTLTRRAEGAPLKLFGNLILHPRSSLTPFTLDTLAREYSRGFRQPAIDTSDRAAILGSVSVVDLQILLGSRHVQPAISYGVKILGSIARDKRGHERPLHTFLLGGDYFSLFGVFSSPLPGWWSRTPGLMTFAASQLMDLDEGESIVLRSAIVVGDRADAASITDKFYTGREVLGTLDTQEAGITVMTGQGQSLTFVRPQADGSFSFRLPQDVADITLTINTPWSVTNREFQTRQPINDIGTIDTGAFGILNLPGGSPMNLVFRAEGGSPVFLDELTGASVGDEHSLTGPATHRISLTGTQRDMSSVQLKPGRYHIFANRGLEYTVTETTVDLRANETLDLLLEAPVRAVQTPGLIGADFHVHAGISFDSSLLPDMRIADFVAQGGEILIPTEHNIIANFQPLIEEMGLQQELVSFPGVEITGMIRTEQVPTTIAHSNVFPVRHDPDAFMGGTLPFEGKRLGQVIGAYKTQTIAPVFQLNHPRDAGHDDDIAFFNHLSFGQPFDPQKPLTQGPNSSLLQALPGTRYRDLDFDAMELLSGEAMDQYPIVRADWFALLKQDIYKVVTANSDSHASHQIVALPRNMLGTTADSPQQITEEELIRTVSAGHLYGTTGPILRVNLEGIPPGGTYHGSSATLEVSVESAPWISVDTVMIWLNGTLWQTLPTASGKTLEIRVDVTQDSFIFVEASGPVTPTYEAIAPGFAPFAFANPVFMDIAGDGWHYGEED